MRAVWRLLPILVVMGFAPYAIAKSTEDSEAPKYNACGCYRNSVGTCICSKKGKCECPGECEPKGCSEKRQKEQDKEIQEKTKRVQEAEKARREAEKKKLEEEAEKERQAEAALEELNAKVPESAAEGEAAGNPDGGDKGKDKKSKDGKKAKKGEKADKADKADKAKAPNA